MHQKEHGDEESTATTSKHNQGMGIKTSTKRPQENAQYDQCH